METMYFKILHYVFLLWAIDQSGLCVLDRAGEFSTSGKKVYPYALTVKDLEPFLGRFGRAKVGGQIFQEKVGDALLIKKEPDVSAKKMQGNRPMPFLTKYPPKYLGSYMASQSHDISGVPKSKTELIDLTGDDVSLVYLNEILLSLLKEEEMDEDVHLMDYRMNCSVSLLIWNCMIFVNIITFC